MVRLPGGYLHLYIIWICFGRFIYTPHIVFCSLLSPARHVSWRSSHVGSHMSAPFILAAVSATLQRHRAYVTIPR